MDIVSSATALLVLIPLGLPLAAALLLTGERKVFYRQTRLGKGAKPFQVLKLATMLQNSENMPGGKITLSNDPRLTPLGGLLRKTKLNELPQLWNVLRGDMTLVGPRPLAPESYEWYSQQVRDAIFQNVPGVTGIGSLVFRDEERIVSNAKGDPVAFYRSVVFPYKGELEAWYHDNKGLVMDFKILLLTLLGVLFPKRSFESLLITGIPARPVELS